MRVALPPTSMTLGGLLKHMAWVEDYWFTEVVNGGAQPPSRGRAPTPALTPTGSGPAQPGDSGDYLRALWAERVKRSNAVVDTQLGKGEAAALGQKAHLAWGGQGRASLRWVLVHMIEEYARHNGHADLIRELIDGETGE